VDDRYGREGSGPRGRVKPGHDDSESNRNAGLRPDGVAMLGLSMGRKDMASASFDFAPLLAPGLPPPAAKWTGRAKYNFIGGNNDGDQVLSMALSPRRPRS